MQEPVEPIHMAVIAGVENKALEGELKELYDIAMEKAKKIIGTSKFDAQMVRPLILQVIDVVQAYSANQAQQLDGSEKKAIAINLIKHVLADLHTGGTISDDIYGYAMMGIDLYGSALMDGLKELYNKAKAKGQEILASNCCSKCTIV